MKVTVNGKPRELPDQASVLALIDALELTGRRIAIEVNGDIVPRSQHGAHRLADGDTVEVVHAIGGG